MMRLLILSLLAVMVNAGLKTPVAMCQPDHPLYDSTICAADQDRRSAEWLKTALQTFTASPNSWNGQQEYSTLVSRVFQACQRKDRVPVNWANLLDLEGDISMLASCDHQVLLDLGDVQQYGTLRKLRTDALGQVAAHVITELRNMASTAHVSIRMCAVVGAMSTMQLLSNNLLPALATNLNATSLGRNCDLFDHACAASACFADARELFSSWVDGAINNHVVQAALLAFDLCARFVFQKV